jgi:hypothetical protein
VWDTFIELHNARGATEAGPLALSWQCIHAWQQVRQASLTDWEIGTLQAMDAAALKVLNKGK